jgi:hypothetical protein
MDAASDEDREWFAAHPGRKYRMREPLPFELPGITPNDLVAVRQVKPGVRFRCALILPAGVNRAGVLGFNDDADADGLIEVGWRSASPAAAIDQADRIERDTR